MIFSIFSKYQPLLLDNLLKTQPKLLPKNLTFRPLSEAFTRRSWYSLLPVLDTTGRRRVKKAVVCVAQLVAALITVHGLFSFLSDVYGLFDPSGKKLWLSVDHRRLRPVDGIVLLSCVRKEYQLLLMKASDRCRNVKFLDTVIILVVFDEFN